MWLIGSRGHDKYRCRVRVRISWSQCESRVMPNLLSLRAISEVAAYSGLRLSTPGREAIEAMVLSREKEAMGQYSCLSLSLSVRLSLTHLQKLQLLSGINCENYILWPSNVVLLLSRYTTPKDNCQNDLIYWLLHLELFLYRRISLFPLHRVSFDPGSW